MRLLASFIALVLLSGCESALAGPKRRGTGPTVGESRSGQRNQRWAVIGDSLPTTPDGNSWPTQLNARWNSASKTVTSFAHGGDSTPEVLVQLSTSVVNQGFTGVIQMSGYNDIKDVECDTPETCAARIETIFTAVRVAGLDLVYVNVPPSADLTSSTIVTRTIDTNALLSTNLSANGDVNVAYFDAVKVVFGQSWACNSTWVSDGIHPNAFGAEQISGLVAVAIP